MALVGQVATVAQLVGVDAYGLITMIAEAARTVRRNRATCRQLAHRVEMIGALLRQLHAAQTQLMQRPETRNPLEELEATLRRAYLLVRSCQRRGYAYRCFMGGRHADELRDVQGEIVFYLQLFPLVSYVDATLAWARLHGKAAGDDDASCREAPMVRPYFVPFLFLWWDGCSLAIVQGVCLGYVSFGAVATTIESILEPSNIEEGRVGGIYHVHASFLQLFLEIWHHPYGLPL